MSPSLSDLERQRSLFADQRHRRAGSEERDCGLQRQTRWLTGSHARGQARLRIHPNQLGPVRLRDSRSRLDHLHRRHRKRPAVRQAALRRGLETRLEPRREEGRPWRRRRMDLESGPATLSRCGSNRRSIPCTPAFVGLGPFALSQRHQAPHRLDRTASETLAGKR